MSRLFFVKYLDNQPVKVKTHYIGDHERVQPLEDVSDLIDACTDDQTRRLLGLPEDYGPLTLHLPNGVDRNALSKGCFAFVDSSETTLDPGCLLASLHSIGTNSRQPLIIKSRNDAQGIMDDLIIGDNNKDQHIIIQSKNDFNTDKMDVDIVTPEQVIKDLTDLIHFDESERNIFHVADSLESLDLSESLLNLQIKSLNGVPNLLYSEEIYKDEKDIGIEMPVDRLIKIKNKTIVLIGVSGCGKTRTCYDLCRIHWGLYFDCTVDVDFIDMVAILGAIRPDVKTEESQQMFEAESQRLVHCLIAARLLVLRAFRTHNPELQQFEWLCIQRSRRSQTLFTKIFNGLSQVHTSVSVKIYNDLKESFQIEGRIIFDETQYMLELLKIDYCSTSTNQQDIKSDGTFAFPRSFFSFLSKIVINSGFNSIWCGTRMRIRSMELIYSAAGVKPENIYIFTDFNYLESKNIFKLLQKWVKINPSENVKLLEEISFMLQGRPRFFISFLHKLIDSSDIQQCFQCYVRDMTTNYDSSLYNSSLYFLWKQRISWNIEPFERTGSAFETISVSETLVKLCVSYLFGNGSTIACSPDLDLVSTCLVMVSNTQNEWHAKMAEPIVLKAGLNFMADEDADVLMNYFAYQLFSPLRAPNLTPQERGHIMEYVIALRFIQGWWLESKLQQYLPQWVKDMRIKKPLGVLDCRLEESNMFVHQLRNSEFPWVIFPSVNAGPDLRYSIFCCYVKTTSTANSGSSMYVEAGDCKKNIETMNPDNWFKSQQIVQDECKKEIENQKFVHIRFELPETAPSVKGKFLSEENVICVNLESEFASNFFGSNFIHQYKKFVKQSCSTLRQITK